MELPVFKYHPNPIETGAVKKSDEACECCGEKRGYTYTSIIFSQEDIETICPWCIADGSASTKFDGEFSDGCSLAKAEINEKIIDEVCKSTPAFNCWQEVEWQSHCNDACKFLGDASKEDLMMLTEVRLDNFLKEELITLEQWKNILKDYVKGGCAAVYKFECTKCSETIYTMDFC